MVCSAGLEAFFLRTCYLISVLVMFALFVWVSERNAVAEDALVTRLDAIFSPLADNKSPGLAVLVRKDGHTVFERGYGVRELRSLAKIDEQTNFRLASCSKQFTAMSIMLLVHDGKLHYDDKLTDVFSDFPAYGKAVTIRNLLNHTSGLPDYEDLMAAAEKRNGAPIWTIARQIQDAEVLNLLEKETAGKFAPGSQWRYSNSGYVVLGLVVAKISGNTFREFLGQRIFTPLKRSQTLAFEKERTRCRNAPTAIRKRPTSGGKLIKV